MDFYTYGDNYYNYLLNENKINTYISFKFMNIIKNIFI